MTQFKFILHENSIFLEKLYFQIYYNYSAAGHFLNSLTTRICVPNAVDDVRLSTLSKADVPPPHRAGEHPGSGLPRPNHAAWLLLNPLL